MTITEIKARYPLPSIATAENQDDIRCYCVGGAICMAAGHLNMRFPGPFGISLILRQLNPRLTRDMALAAAQGIIDANDDSDFVQAWEIAEAAERWDEA